MKFRLHLASRMARKVFTLLEETKRRAPKVIMILNQAAAARRESANASAPTRMLVRRESLKPEANGQRVAKLFRPNKAARLFIGFPEMRVAVTRVTSSSGFFGRTAIAPCERAFLVVVHLTPASPEGFEIWSGDRYLRVTEWPIGGIGIYDLEFGLSLRNRGPVDWVQFQISRPTLEAFAANRDVPMVPELRASYGTVDPVLHRLTEIILPSLDGEPVCEVFLNHFSSLFCAHIAKTYASSPAPLRAYRGGLAPWQRRRVREVLAENLDSSVTLAILAAECGLSVSHFARAFRWTFGRSAHQYLILQRVDKAKALMSASTCALSEAALLAGFSDQAAFSRTFKVVVGTSPGQWRREVSHQRLTTQQPLSQTA